MDIDIKTTKHNIETIITTKKQNIINLRRTLNIEESDLDNLLKFLDELIKRDHLPTE